MNNLYLTLFTFCENIGVTITTAFTHFSNQPVLPHTYSLLSQSLLHFISNIFHIYVIYYQKPPFSKISQLFNHKAIFCNMGYYWGIQIPEPPQPVILCTPSTWRIFIIVVQKSKYMQKLVMFVKFEQKTHNTACWLTSNLLLCASHCSSLELWHLSDDTLYQQWHLVATSHLLLLHCASPTAAWLTVPNQYWKA